MKKESKVWIRGHWRSHPPRQSKSRRRLPIWIKGYWRMKPGQAGEGLANEPREKRREWYKDQTKRVNRAFANDFENRARRGRNARKDYPNLDPTTGELVEPPPESKREKVLTFLFGKKLSKGVEGRASNYGQKSLGLMSNYTKKPPKGRIARSLLICLIAFFLFCAVWGVAQDRSQEREIGGGNSEAYQEAANEEFWSNY